MGLERVTNLFRAFLNAVLGRLEDPQVMLEQTYHALQAQLIQVRQELAHALAQEEQLKRKVEQQKGKGLNTDALEVELKVQAEKIEKLKKRLDKLEQEIQKAYTKKEVLRARNKANQMLWKAQSHMHDHWSALDTLQGLENSMGPPEPRRLVVLLASLTLIWLLACLYLTLHHMHVF